MTWNHRIIHRTHDGEEAYVIAEAFYHDNGELFGWTEELGTPYGDTLDDLRQSLNWMLAAFDKPVIEEKEMLEMLYGNNPTDDPALD